MSTLVTLDFLKLTEYPQFQIVKFQGQIDESNLKEVTDQISSYAEDEKITVLIFDFQELEFLNSKVIGYIADLHSQLAEMNRKLVIVSASNDVMDILELVGLTSLVACYTDINSAVQDLD